MNWQILIAITIITSSVAVLLQRVLMHKDKTDPIAYTIIFQAQMAIFIGAYAFINGFHMPDLVRYWFPIAITCVLYGIGNVLYSKTIQRVEASIFSILLATNAVWVMIISFFLFHERLTAVQLSGALLIFFSVALLAERTGTLKFDKGILMGLLTGFLLGVATVAWIYVGKNSDSASWISVACVGTGLVVLLASPKTVLKMKPFLYGKVALKTAFVTALLCVANIALLMAYKFGKASVIAPLQQSGLILTIILSVVVLRERKNLRRKSMAAILCFLGALLISLR